MREGFADTAPIAPDTVLSIIVQCTREILPELADHNFTRTDSLVALGVNSVDRAEIVMMVLERLSLRIPRVEAFGPRNIGELADLLYQKLKT
jgi:polyketide biosynthesis acyl carrier protein